MGLPVYEILVKEDGTWLVLRGKRYQACINLEVLTEHSGPIVRNAVADVRAILSEQK